jgi:hypothetical protein
MFETPHWSDKSASLDTLSFLETLSLCRLRIKKEVDYSPIAKTRRDADKAEVIKNHKRDHKFDLDVSEEIPLGCPDYALVHNAAKGKASWYTNPSTLRILDIFMFGWI